MAWSRPAVVLLALVTACGSGSAGTTTTSAVVPITTITIATTTTTSSPLPEAPWSAAAIAASEAPEVLSAQWAAADNKATCAALSPVGVEGLEPDATPRAATFAGGWGVAWDRPDGPGMRADGTFCEDCGRSAFGVAGAGVDVDQVAVRAWPDVIEWADGSIAGYGNEGFASDQPVTDPVTQGAGSPTKLAYLAVAGQGCLYNLWSRTSEEELLELMGRLRFVEGLGAPAS